MYKRVLLLNDLEGVNNVVGEPYQGLFKDSEQWHVARKQIALELNAAAEAGIVQNNFIAQCGGAVGDLSDPGGLLLQTLELAVNLFTGDNMAFQVGLQAAISKTHGKKLL